MNIFIVLLVTLLTFVSTQYSFYPGYGHHGFGQRFGGLGLRYRPSSRYRSRYGYRPVYGYNRGLRHGSSYRVERPNSYGSYISSHGRQYYGRAGTGFRMRGRYGGDYIDRFGTRLDRTDSIFDNTHNRAEYRFDQRLDGMCTYHDNSGGRYGNMGGYSSKLNCEEVCFNSYGIGCFSNRPPFDNADQLLPMSPERVGVRFLLYTSRNTIAGQYITQEWLDIDTSSYNGGRKTVFIIHGYQNNGQETWIKEMTSAILHREDINVIAVDWREGADEANYNQSVANTRVVGALLAKLINALHITAITKYNQMYLIGHSLGAHIAGYAGGVIHGIGRITGLDPAGPSFDGKDKVVRLDPTDAIFVDVIHTDAVSVSELGLGITHSVGDADFYPNLGRNQPGCTGPGAQLFNLTNGVIGSVRRAITCSHRRARDLFIESITSACKFKSYPCERERYFLMGLCECAGKCAAMGYDADLYSPRGDYYLYTSNNAPFCMG